MKRMHKQNKEFLQILSDYQGIIHKVNLIYFRTVADREDNFQEVVCQLWRSFPSLKDRTKLASWIYAVAINTSISKIRSDSRLVVRETIPETIQTDTVDTVEQDLNFEQLLGALQQLNAIDKSIMLLYLEDHTYDQIAEIVGISPSNVGVRINRAKKQLKIYLTEERHGK